MTVLLFQPPGASAPVVGAVRSMFTAALSAVVLLPALSATVAVSLRPLPSPVMVLLAGAEATPERSSSAVQSIVTSPLYQPLPLAAVVGLPLSVGAVSSTLMPPTVVLAELPAASTAVPSRDWSVPSPKVLSAVTLSMPDRVSLPSKWTVTSVLFQPKSLAAGVRLPVMVGLVLSRLTVAGSVAVLPALSVAVPVTGWSLPSVVTVWGAVQLAIPDRSAWSSQVKVTVTSALFQPLPFASGSRRVRDRRVALVDLDRDASGSPRRCRPCPGLQ